MVDIDIERLFLTKRPNSEKAHAIAFKILDRYDFKSIKGANNKNEIYVYHEGIYEEKGTEIIEKEVETLCGSFCSKIIVNEVIAKICRKSYIDRDIFDYVDVENICVRNGILNLKTRKLRDHSPQDIFLTKIPICFKEKATCDIWITFLCQSLYERDLDVCQEWFGYCLWKKNIEKKALICIGPKDSGKTVFLTQFYSFLGSKNCSSTDLHDVLNDRFASESLYKKYCNISDELNVNDFRNIVKFKRLTGRTTMQAEPKFKSRFNFEPYSKMICAANKMPMIAKIEDPAAYYDRWIIFELNNIVNEADNTMDKNLTDKLSDDDILSGMLNWALDGLYRLLENGKFSNLRDWRENEKIMYSTSKSPYSFLEQCLTKVIGSFTDNGDLYKAYLKYCDLNDLKDICNNDAFGKIAKPKIMEKFKESRYNGNGKNGYNNIQINEADFLAID